MLKLVLFLIDVAELSRNYICGSHRKYECELGDDHRQHSGLCLCTVFWSVPLLCVCASVNCTFCALTLVGWQEGHLACEKTEWWDDGMVMCLSQGADLLMPQPLATSCSSKFRLVLPFWCRLTQVVLDKIQEGCKVCVCVCVRARACTRVCIS